MTVYSISLILAFVDTGDNKCPTGGEAVVYSCDVTIGRFEGYDFRTGGDFTVCESLSHIPILEVITLN